MTIRRFNQMSFTDAQQFHNVPAKVSFDAETYVDPNPFGERDWRHGVRIETERIPSMVIGQEGFGRQSKHIPRHKIRTVLDILIKREERRISRAQVRQSKRASYIAVSLSIPSHGLHSHTETQRVSRNGSTLYWT